jgi:4-carboxymuconolactone decarboxylase
MSDTRPALDRGRDVVAILNPALEDMLAPYDVALPGFTETMVEYAYGRHYARPGLDLRTRQIATVAALTALGGQTGPQLAINIRHALAAGATRTELLEVIYQMAVYGGMPAAINGINTALATFAALDAAA